MLNEYGFLEFVSMIAEQRGSIFILDSGEGNDFIDESTGWYIEDLSGWLIDPTDKERLLMAKENKSVYEDFSSFYVFATWSKEPDGTLEVTFKHY